MTFYEVLSLALDEQGMTPAELSAKTGMPQSYFSKLKSGYIKDVTWERALQIIDALGMTPNDFSRIEYSVVKLDGDDDE